MTYLIHPSHRLISTGYYVCGVKRGELTWRDGKRLTGQVLEWDMDGKSTTGHSDLNMATIHKGVRVI